MGGYKFGGGGQDFVKEIPLALYLDWRLCEKMVRISLENYHEWVQIWGGGETKEKCSVQKKIVTYFVN